VHDRRIQGTTLSFGHSGILYGNSFVMYDTQSGSLWVHATAKAASGPYQGHELQVLPSTVTRWASWKRAHPDTLVLKGRRAGSFMGTFEGYLKPETIGLAVMVKFNAVLFRFSNLARTPVRNVLIEDEPLLIVFEPVQQIATAWRRTVNARALTFEPTSARATGSVAMTDRETASQWDILTGEAVAGPLQGMALTPASSHPILVERFKAFYPDAPIR
jgi:hypothetical protein